MFDPFRQAKLMNGFDKLKSVSLPESNNDSLDDLKKLAGIKENANSNIDTSINRGLIMRERNIKPGTDEWFKLWFARLDITGEKPY